MRINSKNLIQADQVIDRKGFVLSIFSNWVDLALKIGIKAWQVFCPEKLKAARKNHPNSHYWEYLQDKSWSKCLILSIPIPILTNWIAGKLDTYNVKKAKRILERTEGFNYQQAKEVYDNFSKGIKTIPNNQGADKVNWAAKTLRQDREYMMARIEEDDFSSTNFDIAGIALLYDRTFLIHALRDASILSSDRFRTLRESAPEYVVDCQVAHARNVADHQVALALKELSGNSAVGVFNTVDEAVLFDHRFLVQALKNDRYYVMQTPRYKLLKEQVPAYVAACEEDSRAG